MIIVPSAQDNQMLIFHPLLALRSGPEAIGSTRPSFPDEATHMHSASLMTDVCRSFTDASRAEQHQISTINDCGDHVSIAIGRDPS